MLLLFNQVAPQQYFLLCGPGEGLSRALLALFPVPVRPISGPSIPIDIIPHPLLPPPREGDGFIAQKRERIMISIVHIYVLQCIIAQS